MATNPQAAEEATESKDIDMDMPLDMNIGLKHQMSMESNPFDCVEMDDDLMALTSGDLDVLGNEDQGKSASYVSPEEKQVED